MARTDFRRLERIAPIVTVAPEGGGAPIAVDVDAEGRRRRYEAERRRRAAAEAEARALAAPESVRESAEAAGLVPGLASAVYADPVPLSDYERELNAQRARDAAAARAATESGESVFATSPYEIGRDLEQYAADNPGAINALIPGLSPGIVGGLLRRGSEAVAGAFGVDPESLARYDPVALGAGFAPYADEAIAAAEAIGGDADYRTRQAELEQVLGTARELSPGSALLGTIGGGIASAPLIEAAGVRGLAGAGAAAGGVTGYLGSEGEGALDRAGSTLGGAALGGATGALGGLLTRGGAMLRDVPARTLGASVGRGVAGAGLEGLGGGLLGGAVESGGSLGTAAGREEFARDLSTGALVGGAVGAPLGLASGLARRLARPSEAFTDASPGLADDASRLPDRPIEVDETLAIYDPPTEAIPGGAAATTPLDPLGELLAAEPATGARGALFGGYTPPRNPHVSRLQAMGLRDRAQLQRVARIFGGGERGAERAAEVGRRLGISRTGEAHTVDEAVDRAVRLRDALGPRLGAYHGRAIEARAVARPDRVAAALEAEARRYDFPGADLGMRRSAQRLRARAHEVRYGIGTPEQDEYDAMRRYVEKLPEIPASDVAPEMPPGVPGVESAAPEIRGLTLTQLARPRIEPYAENRQVLDEIANRLGMYERARVVPPASDIHAPIEHRARVAERNLGARARLGDVAADEAARMSEGYRLSMQIAPRDTLPIETIQGRGTLRGAMGRIAGGGAASPSGILSGFAEREFAAIEPSIIATLAEGGFPSAPSAIQESTRRLLDLARQNRVRLSVESLDALQAGTAGRAEMTALRRVGDEIRAAVPPELGPVVSEALTPAHVVSSWPSIVRSAERLYRGSRSTFGAAAAAIDASVGAGVPFEVALLEAARTQPQAVTDAINAAQAASGDAESQAFDPYYDPDAQATEGAPAFDPYY